MHRIPLPPASQKALQYTSKPTHLALFLPPAVTGKPVHSSSSASPSAREEEDAANLSGVPSHRRLEAEEEKEDMLVKEGSSLKAKLGSFLHKASIKANGGGIGASGSPL
jgi:hypothetical protein